MTITLVYGTPGRGAAPRWPIVAQGIIDDITAGRLTVGSRLPSARTLAAKYGAGRHSASAAIQVLADCGTLTLDHKVTTVTGPAPRLTTRDPRPPAPGRLPAARPPAIPDAPAPDRGMWTQAACATVDPEIFFPERDTLHAGQDAKQVCAGCPIRTACLEWALDRDEQFGVWGGFTTPERNAIKRREQVPA